MQIPRLARDLPDGNPSASDCSCLTATIYLGLQGTLRLWLRGTGQVVSEGLVRLAPKADVNHFIWFLLCGVRIDD